MLCEPVEPPKEELEYIQYFCGNTEIAADLKEREPQRITLYKLVASLVRAFANVADEMAGAGFSETEVDALRSQIDFYVKMRDTIRNAAGETLDLKPFEADMRHLIDTYIEANEPRKISEFERVGLLDLIVKTGIGDAIAEKLGSLKGKQAAIAETIENNVRSKIVKEHLNDPAYYDRMSELLDEIIALRRAKAIEYEEYLKRVAELVSDLQEGGRTNLPAPIDTPAKSALFNNLGENADLAMEVYAAVMDVRPDDWRGNTPRENVIKSALFNVLKDASEVERIFPIVKAQSEF